MEYLFRNRQNMKFLIAKNPKLRSAFKFHKNLQESTIFQCSKYVCIKINNTYNSINRSLNFEHLLWIIVLRPPGKNAILIQLGNCLLNK